MALTLVMCYNGLIPFELAAAMVLGENIGTTITANLAAIVANVSAKRTARAHLIFNLFGVFWMLLVFNYFLKGIDFFLHQKHGVSILNTNLSISEFESIKSIYPIGLSLFHTTFNILNTTLLIGFAPFIAKVATKLVKDHGEDDEEFRLKYINSGLVSTSEIAIVQARKEISTFGARLEKMFSFVISILGDIKQKKYYKLLTKIEKYEQITDNLEMEIAVFLTKASEGEISHESSKKIRAMLKMIDDMESIGDALYQLSKIIDNSNQNNSKFKEEQKGALSEMFDILKEAFHEMNQNLETGFSEVDITRALDIEEMINYKRQILRQKHIDDLKLKKYKHKTGSLYSDMISVSERIGDYIFNVSEAMKEYQDTK